tara:strand:+ start:100 stop:381 length:282 start_codon:yes stop_codon:yes gene_type:complete
MDTQIIDPNDPNHSNIKTYLEERDSLLETNRGEYVAYHNGSRVDIGDDRDSLYEKVRSQVDSGVILVQQIIPEEEETVFRLRGPRLTKGPRTG